MSDAEPPVGIDHVVIMTADLDAAREAYARMGFTVTPVNRHPFGTANALVQLQGTYIEILGVADPSLFPPNKTGVFNFPRFNAGFLQDVGEGLSMLAIQSDGPDATRSRLKTAQLGVFAPFSFARKARQPDGSEAEVGFDLTFVDQPSMPQTALFACHHRNPDVFWQAKFQTHANGARSISDLTMAIDQPADFGQTMAGYLGTEPLPYGDGIAYKLPNGTLRLLQWRSSGADVPFSAHPRFVRLDIEVSSLNGLRAVLGEAKVPFADEGWSVTIAQSEACGVTLGFREAE